MQSPCVCVWMTAMSTNELDETRQDERAQCVRDARFFAQTNRLRSANQAGQACVFALACGVDGRAPTDSGQNAAEGGQGWGGGTGSWAGGRSRVHVTRAPQSGYVV